MIHASGKTTSLLPADGGQIRTDKVEFIQGNFSFHFYQNISKNTATTYERNIIVIKIAQHSDNMGKTLIPLDTGPVMSKRAGGGGIATVTRGPYRRLLLGNDRGNQEQPARS